MGPRGYASDARAFWRQALDLLGDGCHRARRHVPLRAELFAGRWLGTSRAVFGCLTAAEACLSAGAPAAAFRMLQQAAGCGARMSRLEHVLHGWLTTALDGTTSCRTTAAAHLARSGANGILRWGQGSDTMFLLQAIPTLLQLVNEADDELAALSGACRWIETQSGADGVAILEVCDGRTLASTPAARELLTPADRRRAIDTAAVGTCVRPDGMLVMAPIRYAGARVGVVTVAGAEDREATLTEAAVSLAALVGPAVRARLDALVLRAHSQSSTPEILGRSPAMGALREAIVRAAGSPFPVLIDGESGCGKELVARAIHRLSPRRDRRFAPLNCAALTDELAETELFGHARGAFTGAVGARVGLFEDAHGGTLFLDEVAELSGRAQAKLLRALQEREVRRIGENAPRCVDVRVVAATNRSLAAMAAQGTFREDLLFRLAVVRLRVPALRERTEDIPLLATRFWRTSASEVGSRAVLGPDALARLARHGWPGNVRELQNVMAAVAVLAPVRGRVSARHVEHALAGAAPGAETLCRSLDGARADCERREVAAALARHAGRRSAAARELGITRQGLAKAIKRLQLDRETPVEGVA
jgi:DNA-binding NtrC family response regulator